MGLLALTRECEDTEQRRDTILVLLKKGHLRICINTAILQCKATVVVVKSTLRVKPDDGRG